MAQKDVEAIIRKSVQDDAFRIALSRNLKRTVESHGLELTDPELEALGQVDWDRQMPSRTEMAAGTWVHIYKS